MTSPLLKAGMIAVCVAAAAVAVLLNNCAAVALISFGTGMMAAVFWPD